MTKKLVKGSAPTRRSFLRSSLGLAAAFGLARASTARAAPRLSGTGALKVYDGGGAWGAALQASYYGPFEQETGIKLERVTSYPIGKIRTGIEAGAPPYDVFFIGGSQLTTFERAGLLLPIDYKYADPADLDALSPNKPKPYGSPLHFASMILAYDSTAFPGATPKVWADVWDLKAFQGMRSLNVGASGPVGATYEIALLADGVPPEKVYPIDWDRAFHSLERLKPGLLKFWTGYGEAIQLLIDKNVTIASTWNGRVVDAVTQGAKISMSWNQGILLSSYWAVPKGAENADNAFKFIAFAMRPEPQAKYADLIAYGPTNPRAFALMKPDRVAIMPTAPALREQQLLQNAEWWATDGRPGVPNDVLATQLWEAWITKH